MEFKFDINNLIGSEISRYDAKLVPFRSCPGGRQYKEQLLQVIDDMGEASAKAQGLRGPITSGDRMKHTDQILYMMKDFEGTNGSAVGILKVGHKKLFVYDSHGNHREMEPLCVLDFYVHESRQRRGCGRKLFDFMLQDQNILAQHLAIDKPSHKFSQFLQKHYNLKATIPQVNNFVIFSGFFHDRHKKPAKAYTRIVPFYSYEPTTTSRSSKSVREPNLQQQRESLSGVSARGVDNHPGSAQSGQDSTARLGGMQTMYSRHSLNPASPLPDIGQSKVSSASSNHGRTVPTVQTMPHNPSVYQDRRGHLRLESASHNHVTPPTQPSSAHITSTHLAQPVNQNHRTNQNGYDDTNMRFSHNQHNQINGQIDQQTQRNSAGKPRIPLNQYERQILSEKVPPAGNGIIPPSDLNLNNKNSGALSKFTPYAELKLPPPDPYARRAIASQRSGTDSSWNVFGVTKTQPATGYASPQRFQNTRPW